METELQNIISNIIKQHGVSENFEAEIAQDMVTAVINYKVPFPVFYNAIVEMAKHANGEIDLRDMKNALYAINLMDK